MAFPQLEQTNYTYADYLKWDEGRWELIDGEVWDMTPAPSRVHQKVAGDLFALMHTLFSGSSCEVYIAPFDVLLPDSETAEEYETFTVVQPDISVICDHNKLNDRGCKGAPDLVIEVLSPATAAKDLKVKRALYEKHGVKEYWLVHPTDKMVMVYLADNNEQYNKAQIFDQEDKLGSALLGDSEIDLSVIFSDPGQNRNDTPKQDAP